MFNTPNPILTKFGFCNLCVTVKFEVSIRKNYCNVCRGLGRVCHLTQKRKTNKEMNDRNELTCQLHFRFSYPLTEHYIPKEYSFLIYDFCFLLDMQSYTSKSDSITLTSDIHILFNGNTSSNEVERILRENGITTIEQLLKLTTSDLLIVGISDLDAEALFIRAR